tara:strand:- start:119 stop:853 length:735 start_codon:yes stop_codon:yes gene_type:complete
MADRFPLVVDSSNNNIKELPSGDNLDLTGCGIVTSSNGNIALTPNGSGVVRIDGTTGIDMESGAISIKNSGAQSYVRFYCESSNAHYAQLQAPAHANFSGNVTLTLPNTTGTLIGGDAENVVKINGAVSEKAATNATISSTTAALDVRDGSVFQLTLASNISTFNWSNHAASGHVSSFVMKVIQDGTGSRTIAWPDGTNSVTVRWPGDTAPTLSSGAADVDVFVFFTHDGGTNYYGFTAGLDML